jgi:hypothetical protein
MSNYIPWKALWTKDFETKEVNQFSTQRSGHSGEISKTLLELMGVGSTIVAGLLGLCEVRRYA